MTSFQQFGAIFLLLAFYSSGAWACTCSGSADTTTVEGNLNKFNAAAKVWIGDKLPTVSSCPPGTPYCPSDMFKDSYFNAFVDTVFKGQDGRGKVVVKDSGFCSAGMHRQTNMLLFGTISEERDVEGYYGVVSVFTPSMCAQNQNWSSLTDEQQRLLLDYRNNNNNNAN